MIIKRFIAVVLSAAMLALTACSEEGVDNNTPTGEATTTTNTTTATTKATTTTAATTEAPKSNVNVNFQTYTYKMKTYDEYEYEITLTLSPWILDTETDALESAWAKVGKGKTLPAKNNMGLQAYADNVYMANLQTSDGRTALFEATMTNMYFSVGTLSVKNVTKGWDFTEEKTGSPKIILNWVKNVNQGSMVIENHKFMSKTYYTSDEDATVAQLYAKPKMRKNTWGPVTVVLAHAENITPKTPNGQYRKYVKEGYLQASGAVNETKITIPLYDSSSAEQTTTQAQTTTKAQDTTAADVKVPSGVKSPKDLVNLAASVFKKDLTTAANTVGKGLNATLADPRCEDYESVVTSLLYDQRSSKMNVMGVSMSEMVVESFKDNKPSCALISFYQNYSDSKSNDSTITPAQAKSAYDNFYKQLKAAYGEPTDNVEKAEKDGDHKSDYSKYYWVQWNTPEGNVWLCWGADLWSIEGYNNCILSIFHPDREKEDKQ